MIKSYAIDAAKNISALAYQDIFVDWNSNSIAGINDIITTVYPNPFSEKINISSNNLINKIFITDITGKTIYQTPVNAKKITIPQQNISNGVYFLIVSYNNTTRTIKLIKK